VRVEALELRRLRLPLVVPFTAAHGTTAVRDVVLVRARTDGPDGWGECGAQHEPTYTAEHTAGAFAVLRDHLAPRLLGRALAGDDVVAALDDVRGHPMAKAALEQAVLDARLRRDGTSLAAWLGAARTAVPAGVAVGVMGDLDRLLQAVDAYVGAGYRRLKLKIAPGWDVAPVEAVRAHVGAGVELAVDANGAYRRDDVDHLRALDAYDLQLLEQPLPPDDLVGAALATARLVTPVGLDESVGSVGEAETALALRACDVVVLKAARVGGLVAARRVHDLCVAAGVGLCPGGLLETGVGRAAALAVAALPGVRLTGDLSASDRYVARDVTAPLRLAEGGVLAVPDGPGLGVDLDLEAVEELTVELVELVAG